MEESSNGGLEKMAKVEAYSDGEKEVVMKDSAALTVEVVDGEDNSGSSSSSSDEEAEPEAKIRPDEVEIFVSDSAVVSAELEQEVSLTEDTSKDIQPSAEEEENSSYLDKTNADSPILTELSTNGLLEETEHLSSAETAEAKGVEEEETTLSVLDESNASTLAGDVALKGIEETASSYLDDNGVLPAAAVPQGISETEIPASNNAPGNSSDSPGSKENVADSTVEDSTEAANVHATDTRDAGEVVNKPEIHESTGNQPIMSISNHPVQATSWRSCCGLFEVLRRSDR